MATIYGAIGIQDYAADQVYIQTVGYSLVYEATQAWLQQYNADLTTALATFVERTTDRVSERYKLPATGRLQRRGGQARSAAAKASGSWDVAYPLEDFGDEVAGDDVALAYLTAAEYQRHLDGVQARDTGTVRFELLKSIFNNTARTFNDATLATPTLTIQPLANGDSVVYPPVAGSETAATRTRYAGSNYLASAVSDTNNPYDTISTALEADFGMAQGGSNIAAFINAAQLPKTRALTGFVPLTDMGVMPGSATDTTINMPTGLPGRIVGRMDDSGIWIVEWPWITSGYIFGLHLDAPKPVIQRVDPAATGLGQGLQLVNEFQDVPFKQSFWRHRFGFGVGNRLNGYVLQLIDSTSYTIPTAYQ